MPKPNISALVSEGASIKARMKTDAARLAEIEAELIPLDAGKYEGPDGTACQVYAAGTGLVSSLNKEAEEACREALGDELFKKLFDRVVSHKPVKGFRDVCAAVLTEAKARKVVGLCESARAAYVKWA